MGMPKITGQETYLMFIGSGALTWEWYSEVGVTGKDTDEWTLSFRDGAEYADQPEKGKQYKITHADVMRAVRKIADGKVGSLTPGNSATVRECRALIFKGVDETDFDAASADNVLQVAAFGEVVYA